ncbi:MAG: hypothetical protein ABSD87_05060 [Candidatus Acidiferrales bacterium]
MRSLARSFMAILLVLALLDIPALAATAKPLGLVVQAREAMLDNSTLAVGTTVFPGDTVQTDEGGTLRLKFGTNQLYLLSSSAATFSQNENTIRATVARGTVGFSSNASSELELAIPQGILRAARGQAASGQVTITNPQEVVISSYQGALVLDNEGEFHTIPAGKTYRVTMDLEPAAEPAAPARRDQDPNKDAGVIPTKRRKLYFELILVGAAAIGTYFIWREVTVSPSLPK